MRSSVKQGYKRVLLLMLKVHKQTKAEQDLIDIWLYTFYEWDEKQADKYLSRNAQLI